MYPEQNSSSCYPEEMIDAPSYTLSRQKDEQILIFATFLLLFFLKHSESIPDIDYISGVPQCRVSGHDHSRPKNITTKSLRKVAHLNSRDVQRNDHNFVDFVHNWTELHAFTVSTVFTLCTVLI